MAFQSALSNDWHLTSVAGVSYVGVTTDHLQHVHFAERRGRARRQFFWHRIALSKALTNIFSGEPPSKGFVACGTNRRRRHQWARALQDGKAASHDQADGFAFVPHTMQVWGKHFWGVGRWSGPRSVRPAASIRPAQPCLKQRPRAFEYGLRAD